MLKILRIVKVMLSKVNYVNYTWLTLFLSEGVAI